MKSCERNSPEETRQELATPSKDDALTLAPAGPAAQPGCSQGRCTEPGGGTAGVRWGTHGVGKGFLLLPTPRPAWDQGPL